MVGVLYTLALQSKLLADLLQVSCTRVEFLDRPLQPFEAQNQGGDVVK